eukprot:4906144-Prymnesium_polylepis.1
MKCCVSRHRDTLDCQLKPRQEPFLFLVANWPHPPWIHSQALRLNGRSCGRPQQFKAAEEFCSARTSMADRASWHDAVRA